MSDNTLIAQLAMLSVEERMALNDAAGRAALALRAAWDERTADTSVTTADEDIVHSREVTNVERLVRVLTELHALVCNPARRQLPPDATALLGPG